MIIQVIQVVAKHQGCINGFLFISRALTLSVSPSLSHALSRCLSLSPSLPPPPQELLPWEGGVHAAGQRGDAHSGGGGRPIRPLLRTDRPGRVLQPGPHHVTALQVSKH